MNDTIRLPSCGVPQLLWGICHTCRKRHPIHLYPGVRDNQLSDWYLKHNPAEGHLCEIRQEDPLSMISQDRRDAHLAKPCGWDRVRSFVVDWFKRLASKRSARRFAASLAFLSYDPNANDLTAYGSSAALTITLASLATSSTLVAGRESTAVSNTSNLYYDYLFGGFIAVGTTPTINTTIEIWGYASQDDTPTYPSLVTSGITGSDAGATAATAGIKSNALAPVGSLAVDATTTARQYNIAPLYMSGIYGGNVPKKWGIWVTHSTAVNLNSTGGNHVLSSTGQYGTS